MITFEWPWLLLLLPLPLLLRYLLPPVPQPPAGAALHVPCIDDFCSERTTFQHPRLRRDWRLLPALLAWTLLVVASARPLWLGDPIELPRSGRDLMLALDLSGSMEQQDFVLNGRPVDRLEALKEIAGDFISRREGDRLGLILFGDQAYLYVPLTFDRESVRSQLEIAEIGLPGRRTAIGDAIGLAVKRMREEQGSERVLILLTDGANNSGELEPLQAAELAAHVGLRIHTIGMGAERMVVNTPLGRRVINPSQELDEAMMQRVAERTGGRYFRARDSAELAQIHQQLDQLEPIERARHHYRPQVSLYPWPLAAALLLATLLLLWRPLRESR